MPACPVRSDPGGDHAVSWGWGGERIARQNLIRNVLVNTGSSTALRLTREDRFQVRNQGLQISLCRVGQAAKIQYWIQENGKQPG